MHLRVDGRVLVSETRVISLIYDTVGGLEISVGGQVHDEVTEGIT